MEEVSWNPPLIQVPYQLLHTQIFYPEKISAAAATAVENQPKTESDIDITRPPSHISSALNSSNHDKIMIELSGSRFNQV